MKTGHVEAILPLSASQRGMLFETLAASRAGIHVEQFAWSMLGELDLEAFDRAWQGVVERHSVLRSCFVWQDRDEPLQVALRQVRVPVERHDWRSLEPAQRSAKLEALLAASRRQPFKPDRAPLMRLAVCRTGEREWRVVWTFHHILMDGWSALVVAREVLTLYEAFSRGREPRLAPAGSYQEYVRWLQRQPLDRARGFWRRRLAGFVAPTPLGAPGEPAGPSEQRYGEQTASLSAAATARLRSLVRQRQLTLSTLIQGVWALLLGRYSGARDVVFGTTVSGRPADLAGVESLVGSFIGTVPMRFDVPAESPLWPWLEEVQARTLEQQEHEHCSSGQIRQWLDLPSSVPLYDSLLVFENYPADSLALSGESFAVGDVRYVGAQTRHALTALVFPEEELRVCLVSDSRRLDAADAGRILEHFLALLESLAAVPDQTLGELAGGIRDERIPRFRALPSRARGDLEDFTPPRTALEQQLAQVWEEVLDIRPIGARDNFFELGGHSLLATQVISRLRQVFQVELPVRELFEAPTVARLAAVVETRRGGEHGLAPPIAPAPRDADLPLSFAQQRLWFLHQLEGPNAAYTIPSALRFGGPLDAAALAGALNEIVRRHEALRTTFRAVDGGPVQVIAPSLTIPLPVTDLRSAPPADQAARVAELLAGEAGRAFDLATGPLIRASLVRISPGTRLGLGGTDPPAVGDERASPATAVEPPAADADHLLLLTMHHIVSDGWSVGVLARELMAFYAAPAAGRTPPLAELEIQYADFAMWQREWLRGEVLEKQLGYWKQQLAGAPPLLELPSDRPRPRIQTFGGDSVRFEIGPDLTARLAALSRRSGTSMFMTLYAAFATVLSRYSGQEDVVIGAPIANRARQETEPLVGFFVNTLALRLDLSRDPTFIELLGRARQTTLDAYAHQDIPFEQLVEELQPERNLGYPPLFQVMLAWQNAPMPRLRLPGLSVEPLEVPSVTSKLDLTLYLEETAGRAPGRTGTRLQGTVEYNTDLFDRATVRRLTEHLRTLLGGDPEQRISDLPLLSGAEQRRILVDWNDTAKDYVPEGHVHQLIEAQVKRSPDAPALLWEDQRLTYSELNQRANRLARRLRALGVGPETLVGISMERSPEMVVGILGILKAGGAYVPIDPTYPPQRLAFMLADARAPVLLTQRRLLDRLPPHEGRVVCLDAEWQDIAREAGEDLVSEVRDENLAYMIYTSGSTGKPKGAVNVHSAIRNRLLWMQEMYPLDETDRVLQKTPFSFDVSVWEFLWPFMTGACLVVARPEGHKDSAYLVRTILEHGITTLHFVPSMLRPFLEEPGLAECVSLRRVICSGEALPPELQERFFARLETAELHNLYGPTEAAIDVSFWPCQRQSARRTVPIGWPIANTQLYLLDPRLRPVPEGVAGELHIGGRNLARGYHERPGLTAEKFIPNPFSAEPGSRLYKTGDLARHLPDGAIQFLGRTDFQIKLRGLRVELGEIEAALERLPEVRECVVVAHPGGPAAASPAGQSLVAYVVGPATHSQLRDQLAQTLPGHMIPSAFVVLEALPLTPNGKLDRRALPAPDETRPELPTAFSPPRSAAERAIAEVWRESLHVDQVGVHDNFFELGGHSLMLIEIHARLRELLAPDLALVALFQYPTISALAEHLTPDAGGTSPPQQRHGRSARQREAIQRQARRMQALSESSRASRQESAPRRAPE